MFANGLNLLGLMATVFFGSYIGTTAMRGIATKYGYVARPRQDRWHQKPTALFGGVGFFPPFLVGVWWVLKDALHNGAPFLDNIALLKLPVALLTGSLLMAVFGLFDDLWQLGPKPKLLAQLLAASLFIFAGGIFPLTGLSILNVLVTYFWFVGITNAINMLDNMDGLCSGVVIVALGTIAVLTAGAAHNQTFGLGFPFALILIASLIGFWIHNRTPARIFMGDTGSLPIGYVVAALTIPSELNNFTLTTTRSTVLTPVMALLIPATVLSIPIFDTTLVTITRKWRSQRASVGGKDHSSHRLVVLGFPEKKTVWLLYGLAAFGGFIAVMMQHFPNQTLPLFGLFALILVLTGVYLGRVKVQTVRSDELTQPWTPLVTDILYKRGLAEITLDTALTVLSFYTAYLLRFDGTLETSTFRAVSSALPIVVMCCLTSFYVAGIYRGQWRLISAEDLPRYTVGTAVGVVFSLAMVTLLNRFTAHSRGAFVIFGILLLMAVCGVRLSFRLFDAFIVRQKRASLRQHDHVALIYGAGKAGKLLCEEIVSNPGMRDCTVSGFIDDDHTRMGRTLCGLPIRSRDEWTKNTWREPPEIWISSELIPNQLAQDFARRLPGKCTIRRFRMHVEILDESDGLADGKSIDLPTSDDQSLIKH